MAALVCDRRKTPWPPPEGQDGDPASAPGLKYFNDVTAQREESEKMG